MTCYENNSTVAGQRIRAQQRNSKHHVTQQYEAAVFPGYITDGRVELNQYPSRESTVK
jgi:hypothetical protein